VGFAISCCVYGIFLSQVGRYFSRFRSDRLILKLTVIIILILVTADQAFIGHLVYFYSISSFAKPKVLMEGKVTWSLILQLTVGAITGAIVKCAFASRVWRFSGRNKWITGLIVLLLVAHLAISLAFASKSFELPGLYAVVELQILGTISLGIGVVTDIVTAGALCIFLNRLRTGYQKSDSLVDSLVRYAINTGGLTSAVSVTTLLLFNIMATTTLYFAAVYFTLSKLYAISYMATLNTRRTVSGRGTDERAAETNHTNMFALGTRVPSMGPEDFHGRWESAKSDYLSQGLDLPSSPFPRDGRQSKLGVGV